MKTITYPTKRLLLGTILLSACSVPMLLAGALSNTAYEQPGAGLGNIAYAQEPTSTPAPVVPCGGRIGSGDFLEDSIPYMGVSCEYVFDGTAGTEVEIAMRAVSGNLDPLLTLIDPNGQIVAQNDDLSSADRNSLISYTLPQDGPYTIVAGSYANASSGDFQLTLHKRLTAPTGQPAPPLLLTGCGGFIEAGQVRSDRISNKGQQCSYRFDGQIGDVVTIRMDGVSNGIDPVIELYAPSNSAQSVASNDDAYDRNSIIWPYRLRENGQYEIKAYAYGAGTGDYKLLLSKGTFQRDDTVQQIYSPAVNIRRAPGSVNKPQGDVLDVVPIGTMLTVVGGPRTANGLTWWQVRYRNASGKLIIGWMAEARATGEPILAPAMP